MRIAAATVHLDDATLRAEPADGRTAGVPVAWFPRLLHASSAPRTRCRIGVTGRAFTGKNSMKASRGSPAGGTRGNDDPPSWRGVRQ